MRGLTDRLDYISDGDRETGEDFGFDGLWLTPVFSSPTYHKYDVADYLSIDPSFGDMEDYEELLEECRLRGIRLIMDLPVNHTSTEHPWFQAAAEYLKALPEGASPSVDDCPYLEYYNFTDQSAYGYAPLEGTSYYYEAQFWEGMPDLNLDSEAVRAEIASIMKFWLEKGVYGFRLDAVTYYYTGNDENGVSFLKWIADTVHEIREDAYLVGEAWTSQERYATFYTSGVDSLFDFQFAGQDGVIARVVRKMTDAAEFGRAMEREEALYASYSDTAVNAPFYTNHDFARSAGYYPGDDGSRTKLAGALNLLMPGNVFVYYGEELGMKGSGKDENKRAPMLWGEMGVNGMCSGPEGMDRIKMKFGSYEQQAQDASSIYRYYLQAVQLRSAYPVIAQGKTKALDSLSDETLGAFVRTDGTGHLTILFNTADETRTISLAGTEAENEKLVSSLLTGEEEAVLNGNTLTLPSCGIAILQQDGH